MGTWDRFRQVGGLSRNRTLYLKIRYLYYYYVSGRMRDYDYGQSLLGKRPYLVTGLQPREVRTDAILGGADIDRHPGPCVI